MELIVETSYGKCDCKVCLGSSLGSVRISHVGAPGGLMPKLIPKSVSSTALFSLPSIVTSIAFPHLALYCTIDSQRETTQQTTSPPALKRILVLFQSSSCPSPCLKPPTKNATKQIASFPAASSPVPSFYHVSFISFFLLLGKTSITVAAIGRRPVRSLYLVSYLLYFRQSDDRRNHNQTATSTPYYIILKVPLKFY